MVFVATVIICLMFFFMGCSTLKQSAVQFEYTSGCHMRLDMINQEKADKIVKDFNFTDCELEVDSEMETKPKEKEK